jgi:hypothetical protein
MRSVYVRLAVAFVALGAGVAAILVVAFLVRDTIG